MCPEIMNKKEYLGPPVDVWAAGVILYILSCGTFPFKSALSSELHRVISKGIFNIPAYVPTNAQNLIKRLLIVDPAKRLCAQDILFHSYFNKI
jgi:serine/threonine protein kinase